MYFDYKFITANDLIIALRVTESSKTYDQVKEYVRKNMMPDWLKEFERESILYAINIDETGKAEPIDVVQRERERERERERALQKLWKRKSGFRDSFHSTRVRN